MTTAHRATLAPEVSFSEISATQEANSGIKCDNQLQRKTLDIGSNVELLKPSLMSDEEEQENRNEDLTATEN
jgi:hypothetical protein